MNNWIPPTSYCATKVRKSFSMKIIQSSKCFIAQIQKEAMISFLENPYNLAIFQIDLALEQPCNA